MLVAAEELRSHEHRRPDRGRQDEPPPRARSPLGVEAQRDRLRHRMGSQGIHAARMAHAGQDPGLALATKSAKPNRGSPPTDLQGLRRRAWLLWRQPWPGSWSATAVTRFARTSRIASQLAAAPQRAGSAHLGGRPPPRRRTTLRDARVPRKGGLGTTRCRVLRRGRSGARGLGARSVGSQFSIALATRFAAFRAGRSAVWR